MKIVVITFQWLFVELQIFEKLLCPLTSLSRLFNANNICNVCNTIHFNKDTVIIFVHLETCRFKASFHLDSGRNGEKKDKLI